MKMAISCLILIILVVHGFPAVVTLVLDPQNKHQALDGPRKEAEIIKSIIKAQDLDEMRKSNKISEFIKHLGIPNEGLCQPDKDENMDPMFNEDLDFGDLILDKKNEDDKTEDDDTYDTERDFDDSETTSDPTGDSEKKGNKKNIKWEDGIIPYYISNDYSSEVRQTIEEAIEWMNSRLTNVQFRPYDSDENYVVIFSGKGCYAKLGMAGGPQPVSLQSDKCLKTGTIQHEMMHAVGFSHEQNRPDRDDYIKILYSNIPNKWRREYERNNPSEAAYVGTYDYYSCMHYPPEAPGGQGDKRAFEILDDTIDEAKMGDKSGASETDIEKIDEYYGAYD